MRSIVAVLSISMAVMAVAHPCPASAGDHCRHRASFERVGLPAHMFEDFVAPAADVSPDLASLHQDLSVERVFGDYLESLRIAHPSPIVTLRQFLGRKAYLRSVAEPEMRYARYLNPSAVDPRAYRDPGRRA